MEIKEIKIPDAAKKQENEQILEGTYDGLSTFKAGVVNQNSEFISKQGENMKRFVEQIKGIQERLRKNKQECEQSIKKMEDQTDDLDRNVEKYTKQMKLNNKEAEHKNQIKKLKEEYIKLCKERIITAQKLQMMNFSKLDMEDRKSKANEVFKWIIVTMYDEAQSKYYWPNFLSQAIKNDEGKDLKERLGKINASKAKQEQKLKTQSFLQSFQQIKSADELKDLTDEIEKIRDVANCFRRGYETTSMIKECEAKIVKHKQKTLEKDEQFMRQKARSEALKDRIKVKRQYHKILTYLQQKLSSKQELYRQKSEQADKIAEQFSKLLHWKPTVNISSDEKSQCECVIF